MTLPAPSLEPLCPSQIMVLTVPSFQELSEATMFHSLLLIDAKIRFNGVKHRQTLY